MANFNEALIADLRAHGGHATSGPFVGRAVLILTTTGAKSGEQREIPLAYTRDGDDIVIVASMGGAPRNPAWYHNLVAHPIVTVQFKRDVFEADAARIEGDELAPAWALVAEKGPWYVGYQEGTDRDIPLVRLRRR